MKDLYDLIKESDRVVTFRRPVAVEPLASPCAALFGQTR